MFYFLLSSCLASTMSDRVKATKGQGSQKITWIEVIRTNVIFSPLTEEVSLNRVEWKETLIKFNVW